MATKAFPNVVPGPQERSTPVPLEARTASGQTDTLLGYGAAKYIRAQLNITAASGTTPTLDVVLEDSVDNGANWNVMGQPFPKANKTGRSVLNVTEPFSDLVRVRWTIGGTGASFTFAVDWVAE